METGAHILKHKVTFHLYLTGYISSRTDSKQFSAILATPRKVGLVGLIGMNLSKPPPKIQTQ